MDLESNSELDHADAMGRARAEIARLNGDLAKEREKFTMHTAHVHAWLSAVVQELGIAKTRQVIDVATVCTKVMDEVKVATSERREHLKRAFVAGCCAVLSWTNAGMPQDDLDEAGYDYAANVLANGDDDDGGRIKPLGTDDAENGCLL